MQPVTTTYTDAEYCPVSTGVNVEDLTKRFHEFFGPGTVYDLPLNDPYRKKGGTVLVWLPSINFAISMS